MALFCCICERSGRSVPNFSKDRNTGLGYCSSHQNYRTDKTFKSIQQRSIEKHKEQKKRKPEETELSNYDLVVGGSLVVAEDGVDDSLKNLSDDLDQVLSLYIRHKYADKKGMVKCFTCSAVLPIKEIHNGHYIKRGNRSTRFLEANLRPQCPTCNQDHNYDETPYTNALEAENPGITDQLRELSKETYKATRAELKSLLIEYRSKLELLKKNRIKTEL